MRKKSISMHTVYFHSFLLFLVVHLLFAQSSTDKPTIAVMPLKTQEKKVTPETIELSNWIIFKSFTLGVKNIMELEETQRILQTDAGSGIASCNLASCIYRAGALLGVEKIIWGTLASDAVQNTLTLYLSDVVGEDLINTVTIQIKGSARDIQSHLTPVLQRLYAKSPDLNATKRFTQDTPTMETPLSQPAAQFETVTLKLLSEPSGATVFVNDEMVGTTPFETDSLKAGFHKIRLKLPGFQEFSKTFTFSRGAKKKYLIKLATRFGSMAVFSEPAGASVVMNSDTLGQTPFFCDTLEPGHYTLNCFKPKYVLYTAPVTIVRAESDTFTVKLTSQAYVDSLKQIKSRRWRWTRRIVFGVIAAGFTAGGVYYNLETQTALDTEDAAWAEYDKPNMTESHYNYYIDKYNEATKETDALVKKRNVYYIFGGIFGACFCISIPF